MALEPEPGPGDAAQQFVGRTLGDRYRLDQLIGKGGAGWVFRGTQLATRQAVTVKVMRQTVGGDAGAVRRFHQEARASGALKHRNTLRIHGSGVLDEGYPYLVMESYDGRSLADVLESEGALSPARTLRIAVQICRSLEEAHERGLVHRNLEPASVLLTQIPGAPAEHVKITDCGIGAPGDGGDPHQDLTQSLAIEGPFRYLSPEQAQAGPLDGRSDLYSLGVVVYQMLTGSAPFDAASAATLLLKQLRFPAPPLPAVVGGRPISDAFRGLVAKLLERAPEQRPRTAREVGDRLQAILDGPPRDPASRPHDHRPVPGGPKRWVATAEDNAPTRAIPSRRGAPTGGDDGVEDPTDHIVSPYSSPSAEPPPAARRGRGWLWALVALAAVLIAAAVAVALYLAPRIGGRAEPAVAEPVEVETPIAAVPAQAGVDVLEDVDEVGEDVPPAPPRVVTILSDPVGAAVYEGPRKLGRTPLSLDIPADAPRTVRIERRGYETAIRVLTGDSDAVAVPLQRTRRDGAGGRRGVGQEPEQETATPAGGPEGTDPRPE
jgi:serine/threonine-protein kinase